MWKCTKVHTEPIIVPRMISFGDGNGTTMTCQLHLHFQLLRGASHGRLPRPSKMPQQERAVFHHGPFLVEMGRLFGSKKIMKYFCNNLRRPNQNFVFSIIERILCMLLCETGIQDTNNSYHIGVKPGEYPLRFDSAG